MKNVLFLSLFYCVLLAMAGCSGKLMPEGHFQSKPVIVNGNIGDRGDIKRPDNIISP